ncbi:MAG: TonB-dependent receptor, partial [Candidatus Neomarinimicrobiota bacterium]
MKVLLISLVLPMIVLAQTGMVTGTVTDSETGDALAGANVVIVGTTLGAAADADGNYSIANVSTGMATVTASVIGYESDSRTVTVTEGGTATANFTLAPSAIMLSGLEILASRATRETPVAYTNVGKSDINLRLGSQDIPLMLNTTPSVYATQQGGGAGDSRMNIRGFNQRNVSIMINGVPVNDMENGWVYWSNWDGIADATSSIQMQRGLSAVNLAAPSIGGTMNILTDPTARDRGGLFKQEYGSGTFLKTTASYHTGMIGDKLAMSGAIVRKTGDGVIDKAWTDAWAYYFGASYALNKSNRFEFYALGAPQRHGQMRYAQNIAVYDEEYARDVFDQSVLDLDVSGAEDTDGNDIANGTPDVFDTFPEASADRYGDYDDAEGGRFYSENWNTVSSSYKGKQYYYMYGDKTVDRHDPDYLNESENYYHKPQVNLNWFLTLNEQMRLSSVFYYSGGSGGGTGTFNDMQWDYSGPSRSVNWDKTIATNRD